MDVSDIDIESLTALHWIAVGLAIITGLIHLALGVMFCSVTNSPVSVHGITTER